MGRHHLGVGFEDLTHEGPDLIKAALEPEIERHVIHPGRDVIDFTKISNLDLVEQLLVSPIMPQSSV